MNFQKLTLPLLCTSLIPAHAQQQKPNIVIILADDLGFSDLGCFGGEIRTPNLDGMAKNGLRMTEMYNSARSCPSRACLMTGLYPHQAGMGHMDGERNWPKGYSGLRNTDNVTIAEVLQKAGYFTAMAGKWHLGGTPPTERGFEEYFGLLHGFDSFWDIHKYSRLPKGRKEHFHPEGSFYATNAITDYAIDFAKQAKEAKKPLFLYLAYNAPHFPLQAPKERIDKYMATYLQGWDKIRDQRFKRLVQMGLLQGHPDLSSRGVVPASMMLDEAHPIPTWDSLNPDQQKDLARRMAIYAAMVDILDENIGRFTNSLKQLGELDNTLLLFMSDNGACAEWTEFGFDQFSGLKSHLFVGAELDQMGQPGTYHHYGTGWANLCCTPFTLYKHFAHEGGISTPFIACWGNNIKHKGGIDHQPAHFTDIMTTCLDAAGAGYPKEFEGYSIIPMEGKSLLPILKGKKLPTRAIFAEHEGNRMVRLGDWKLVAAHFKGLDWELYNIRKDRTEQHNLATKYPEKVKELEKMYFEWADRSDVKSFPQMWNKLFPNKPFNVYKEK